MKQLVVYSMIFLFGVTSLAPNMQGMQLLKLPQLLQHVEDHFGSNWTAPELGAFLSEHYASRHLPEDEKHSQLPFKVTVVAGVGAVALIYQQISPVTETVESEIPTLRPIVHPASATCDRTGNIWTPPQLI